MFNISQYLEKFKNIGQSERLLKEAVFIIIKEVVGVEVEAKNISVRNGEIIFKVSPAIKNAIYIKKELILNKINERSASLINNVR